MFAAALVDHNRASCMGEPTVGKNVAQAIVSLSDGSGLVFTIREFLSPLGRSMGDGVRPSIEVAPSALRWLDVAKLRYDGRGWSLAGGDAHVNVNVNADGHGF